VPGQRVGCNPLRMAAPTRSERLRRYLFLGDPELGDDLRDQVYRFTGDEAPLIPAASVHLWRTHRRLPGRTRRLHSPRPGSRRTAHRRAHRDTAGRIRGAARMSQGSSSAIPPANGKTGPSSVASARPKICGRSVGPVGTTRHPPWAGACVYHPVLSPTSSRPTTH